MYYNYFTEGPNRRRKKYKDRSWYRTQILTNQISNSNQTLINYGYQSNVSQIINQVNILAQMLKTRSYL